MMAAVEEIRHDETLFRPPGIAGSARCARRPPAERSPPGRRAGQPGVAAGGPARPQVQGRPLAMDDLVAWCMLATPAPGLDHWDVCWLPDGDSVLFSYLQQERPGLFRVDLGTRQVSPWLGAERLQYPKCSPQGRVFAMELLGPDSAAARRASLGYWVFLPERGTWEEVAVPGAQYANWTRDGQALIGLNRGFAHREVLARHAALRGDRRRSQPNPRSRARQSTVDGPRRDRRAPRDARRHHVRPLRPRLGGAVGSALCLQSV